MSKINKHKKLLAITALALLLTLPAGPALAAPASNNNGSLAVGQSNQIKTLTLSPDEINRNFEIILKFANSVWLKLKLAFEPSFNNIMNYIQTKTGFDLNQLLDFVVDIVINLFNVLIETIKKLIALVITSQ